MPRSPSNFGMAVRAPKGHLVTAIAGNLFPPHPLSLWCELLNMNHWSKSSMASICFHQSVHSQKWVVSNYFESIYSRSTWFCPFHLVIKTLVSSLHGVRPLSGKHPQRWKSQPKTAQQGQNWQNLLGYPHGTWVKMKPTEIAPKRLATWQLMVVMKNDIHWSCLGCNRGHIFDPQKLYTHLPSPGDSLCPRMSHAVRGSLAQLKRKCITSASCTSLVSGAVPNEATAADLTSGSP